MTFLTWLRYLGEKRYSWVDVKDVDPRELRRSKIPDDFLSFICIQFKKSGALYHADHFPETVHLEGIDCDGRKFGEIEKAVAEACWGEATGDVKEKPPGRLCSIVDIPARQTQDIVALALEKRYRQAFPDARIDLVHFHDVPISLYQDSGFQKIKLTYGELSHAGRVDSLHMSLRPSELISASQL